MTTSTELVPAEKDTAVDLVKSQVEEAERQADLIQVTTPEQDAQATAFLQQIAARKKAAEAKRKELTGPLNKTLRLLNQEFKDAMAPFDVLDEKVRPKVIAYRNEQERIRKAEEDRLEAERQERERKIREERERQEAEARAKREQAEKEAREAEALQKAAEDKADAEAAEKLAEEAKQAAQEAQTAESAISNLPDVQLPKAVVEQAPTPDGSSTPKRWVAEVTDASEVPDFLPDGTPLKVVDEVALRKYMLAVVKETGQAPPEMPGAEFKQVSGLAVKAP